MRKVALTGAVVALGALLGLSGCKDTGHKPRPALQRTQAPEYDCRKQDDKICEVPRKDKVVLYCYKGKIPKVVRYKEECS